VTAIEPESATLWIFSTASLGGSGTLERIAELRSNEIQRWSVPAKWTYDPQSGVFKIETTKSHTILLGAEIAGRVPSPFRSAMAQVKSYDSSVARDRPIVSQVVIVIEHDRDFLTEFRELYACASRALSDSQ
jgi:hypothetical protein